MGHIMAGVPPPIDLALSCLPHAPEVAIAFGDARNYGIGPSSDRSDTVAHAFVSCCGAPYSSSGDQAGSEAKFDVVIGCSLRPVRSIE